MKIVDELDETAKTEKTIAPYKRKQAFFFIPT